MAAPPRPLRAELGPLVRLALPLAAAQGGQALLGVVDTAIVGRAGPLPLAAAGLGNALYLAIVVFGMGAMHGLDPLVSQAVGAGDPARARRLLWQGVWLSLGLAGALSLPCILAPLALEPLGIEPGVAREAGRYLLGRLPGLPFFLAFLGGRSYLQALGTPRPIVVSAVVANVANVPLDLLLVFGGASLPAPLGPLRAVPALGAAGAAVASSLCSALQVAVLALATRAVRIPDRVARTPHAPDLRAALRVGVPIGLHMGAEVGIFALVGFLAARLGELPMAAHQIAISVASVSFTVALGLGNAGSVRVGWAVGARDLEGARRAGLAAFGAAGAFMSLAGLAFFLFPGAIARTMTDDPAAVAAAVPLLRVAAVFQVSDGIQGVGAGVLRGAGETRFTFLANVAGHWALGFPAAVLLGFTLEMGVTGLWWGFVLGLSAVAVALLVRFLRISSREIAPLAGAADRLGP